MQSILRVTNIVLGPVLTLVFASSFQGLTIAGKEAGDVVGGAAAGLVVLGRRSSYLTQGPRYSAWVRRWLDPQGSIEGVWFQDVFQGQGGNDVPFFPWITCAREIRLP